MNKAVKRTTFGAIVGAIMGFAIGFTMFIVGLVLTATIIGAIVGIPLIIAGVSVMIVGPFSGGIGMFLTKNIPCPNCKTNQMVTMARVFRCKACRRTLYVHGQGDTRTLSLVA